MAVGLYFLLPRLDPALPQAAAATAALAGLMAVWWMTEAIPLEATALLPLVLLPLLGVYSTPIEVGDVVEVRPLKLAAKVVSLENRQAVVEWKLPSDPWFFLVDRKGFIFAKFEGPTTRAELEESLERMLRA